MMRSMFSAVSGLRVHQTKMDVIANNIANVNTVGFKSGRVTFNEVFSQTISGATAANPEFGRGGVNPKQIGLGASVASIDNLMTQGASQRTDNALDLMIQGDGFFIVGDSTGTYFTRSGVMSLDASGRLVNSSGLQLYGWDAIDDTTNPGQQIIEKGKTVPIVISSSKEYLDPTTTKNISLTGNLNNSDLEEVPRTVAFFDTLGNRYTIDINLKWDATGKKWDYSFSQDMYLNNDRTKPINIGNIG